VVTRKKETIKKEVNVLNSFKKKTNTEKIIIVTGATGFSGAKSKDDAMWTYSCPITAWKRVSESILIEERKLILKGERSSFENLISQIKCDSIYKVLVTVDNGQFNLVKIIDKSSDSEMDAFLAQQIAPIYLEDEELGEFVLERSVNWFEKTIDWLGTEVTICFSNDEKNFHQIIQDIRSVMSEKVEWDTKVRVFVADDLLDYRNETCLQEGEEPLTHDDFQKRIVLNSISFRHNGQIEFWFGDDDIFFGHLLTVNAQINSGCISVDING